MRGYEVNCKRNRFKKFRPRYKVGDRVRLRDGTITEVTRITVEDWATMYDLRTGAVVAQHHIMEKVQ